MVGDYIINYLLSKDIINIIYIGYISNINILIYKHNNAIIYSFEPLKSHYNHLAMKYKSFDNISISNKGISSHIGKKRFYENILDLTSSFEKLDYDSEYLKYKTKILGVSILTSLNSLQTKKYFNEPDINKLVKKYVSFAKKNKLDGIVCSPLEIKFIRQIVGSKFLIVVPGIRPKSYKKIDDQKRFISPEEAIKLGADLLVIGRPITESKNPLKTIKEINKSIN